MSNEEQIDNLNAMVKVKIAPSPIGGVGVFAIRDISKGQKLYCNFFPFQFSLPYSSFGKLFPEVRELLLERWPTITMGSKFFYPETCLQAYINHSQEPNYDCVNDIALKDIKVGEEVTEDYKLIPGWEVAYPWLVEVKPKKRVAKKNMTQGMV